MNKLLLPVILAVLGFQLSAQDITPDSQKKRVLLAYESTVFKKKLIQTMNSMLEKDSISTVIVEHSNGALDKENIASYQAVFITNSGVYSKVRPWISEWIKKNEKHSSMIVLHTTQVSNWKVGITGVDAVTSASKNKDVNDLASKYVEMIKTRLASSR